MNPFAPIAPEWTNQAIHAYEFCCPSCRSRSLEAEQAWLNRRSPVFTDQETMVKYGVFAPVTPAIIAPELMVYQFSVKRIIRALTDLDYIRKRHETEKLVGYEIK